MSFQSDLGDHVREEYCHCPPHFEMPKTFRCSLCHKTYLPGWENEKAFDKNDSGEKNDMIPPTKEQRALWTDLARDYVKYLEDKLSEKGEMSEDEVKVEILSSLIGRYAYRYADLNDEQKVDIDKELDKLAKKLSHSSSPKPSPSPDNMVECERCGGDGRDGKTTGKVNSTREKDNNDSGEKKLKAKSILECIVRGINQGHHDLTEIDKEAILVALTLFEQAPKPSITEEDINRRVEHRTQMLHDLLKDACDDDTEIRKMAKEVLTEYEVEGDSYGVPCVTDIVRLLVDKIITEKIYYTEATLAGWIEEYTEMKFLSLVTIKELARFLKQKGV